MYKFHTPQLIISYTRNFQKYNYTRNDEVALEKNQKELIFDFFFFFCKKQIAGNSMRISKQNTKTPHQTAIYWFGSLTTRHKSCVCEGIFKNK